MTLPFIQRARMRAENPSRLTIIKTIRNKGRIYHECRCECGNVKFVRKDHFNNGKILSCGCYRIDKHTRYTEGDTESYHSLYKIWIGIKQRCYNKNNPRFDDYGGRGIKMWDEWRYNYTIFRDYMLALPSCPVNATQVKARLNRTVDRYPDNDGNYEPGNVRWATREEQDSNRRVSRIITYENVTGTIKQITDRFGLASYRTTLWRIDNGWPIEKALRTLGAI